MDKNNISKDQEKLKLLNGMTMLMQSCIEEEELFDVLYWYLPELYPETRGGIYLKNETNGQMEQVFTWGIDGEMEISPDPLSCPAFKNGRPVDTNRPKHGIKLSDKCSHDSYCVPLLDAMSTFGVLKIENKEISKDKHQRGLGFISAEFIAMAISNLRLRKKLREMTLIDPLTNLHNRRYLDDALISEAARAKRRGSNLGVIMVDLDHFKKLNDSKGHDAGDQVLKIVSHALKKGVRKSDVVCRYGGEEFVILISDGEYKDFLNRAESLRETISKLSMTHNGTEIKNITASLGVASLPVHGNSIHSVLKAADEALYKAKNSGRNRVIGAT